MTKMANHCEAFAAYSRDEEERLNSSSGGIFSLLAKSILSNHGVVYGVSMSSDCREAVVEKISNEENLYKLRGSKYLQASVGNAFRNIKKDLDEGLTVLYSGTPCQIIGLKLFLEHDYEHLYCVDVICHGVPSSLLWHNYIDYVEEKSGEIIKSVNFRAKMNGWANFGMKETIDSHRAYYSDKDTNPYMQMFLKNYCLRPSCYECKAKQRYMSDITLGDFWGINNVVPDMNDNKGVSFVVIRTAAGKKLFASIADKAVVRMVSYSDGARGNSPLQESVSKPIQRETFFIDMKRMDFNKLKKRYLAMPIMERVKTGIKKLIKYDKIISGG